MKTATYSLLLLIVCWWAGYAYRSLDGARNTAVVATVFALAWAAIVAYAEFGR